MAHRSRANRLPDLRFRTNLGGAAEATPGRLAEFPIQGNPVPLYGAAGPRAREKARLPKLPGSDWFRLCSCSGRPLAPSQGETDKGYGTEGPEDEGGGLGDSLLDDLATNLPTGEQSGMHIEIG